MMTLTTGLPFVAADAIAAAIASGSATSVGAWMTTSASTPGSWATAAIAAWYVDGAASPSRSTGFAVDAEAESCASRMCRQSTEIVCEREVRTRTGVCAHDARTARVADDGNPSTRRKGLMREHQGRVEEVVDRVDPHDAAVLEQRFNGSVVGGHRRGV